MAIEESVSLSVDLPTPGVITDSRYDYDWYKEHRTAYSLEIPIFTRQHLTRFQDLVDSARNEEITANEVLAYINPQVRVSIQGDSPLDTLGFYLDQRVLSIATSRDIPREEVLSKLQEVDARRLDLLGAVGTTHPYIWSSRHEVRVQPKLGSGDDSQDADPIQRYTQAVEKLFDLIESTYDREEIIAFLTFGVAEMKYMLEHNIGRAGTQMTETFRKSLTERIKHYNNGIDRLSGQSSNKT